VRLKGAAWESVVRNKVVILNFLHLKRRDHVMSITTASII
jgi:hypothetical protein